MKRITVIFSLIFLLGIGFTVWQSNRQKVADNKADEIVRMCYVYSNKTPSGLEDKSVIKINILGENVAGEFGYYPAEKDAKTGTFAGTVGAVDQMKMARTINAWAETVAEGVTNNEELIIDFGDGSAAIAFGEMEKKGENVYFYKDKTKLTYGPALSQVDCSTLETPILNN